MLALLMCTVVAESQVSQTLSVWSHLHTPNSFLLPLVSLQ